MSFCPYYLLGLSPDCQVCSCLTYTEYFSTKEGDKPELCISYKQQFTHSFKSTSVVLDPHPVSWPCPPWIWLLSLYYPISGLYPKIFFMCACLMRFVCQGLGRAVGLEGWIVWGATRNFPHTWYQAHHLSGSISKWKKRRKKKGGGKVCKAAVPLQPMRTTEQRFTWRTEVQNGGSEPLGCLCWSRTKCFIKINGQLWLFCRYQPCIRHTYFSFLSSLPSMGNHFSDSDSKTLQVYKGIPKTQETLWH